MTSTPAANRLHIGFFGKRNAGKSSLVNAVTGQNLAIVSNQKGTTTDPVSKAMELLPLGPVLVIDTPGIDDEGALGELRVRRMRGVLDKTDVAVLVVDVAECALAEASQAESFRADGADGGAARLDGCPLELAGAETELIGVFRKKKIPFVVALNKSDLIDEKDRAALSASGALPVSAKTGLNIHELKERIALLGKTNAPPPQIVADLIKPDDVVVLVTPIDEAAPKGRLILPQQQTIRDILDARATAIVVQETQFKATLGALKKKPALVITDSQVFARVAAETPADIPLTSFSILFARLKGFFADAVRGARAIDRVKDGDTILVCEGCTHHRQCDDIGTVKIPRMIQQHTGKNPRFVFCSGADYPDDLSPYKLVLHCGACMLNDREVEHRRAAAEAQNIQFTNYGIAITHIAGILERSIALYDA